MTSPATWSGAVLVGHLAQPLPQVQVFLLPAPPSRIATRGAVFYGFRRQPDRYASERCASASSGMRSVQTTWCRSTSPMRHSPLSCGGALALGPPINMPIIVAKRAASHAGAALGLTIPPVILTRTHEVIE